MAADHSYLSEPSLGKILIGLAGSVVSLKWVKGTWPERILMAFGGAALSYFGTTPLHTKFGLQDAEGLVGFFLGLFGMALINKGWELIQAIDAAALARDLHERFRQILGVKKNDGGGNAD